MSFENWKIGEIFKEYGEVESERQLWSLLNKIYCNFLMARKSLRPGWRILVNGIQRNPDFLEPQAQFLEPSDKPNQKFPPPPRPSVEHCNLTPEFSNQFSFPLELTGYRVFLGRGQLLAVWGFYGHLNIFDICNLINRYKTFRLTMHWLWDIPTPFPLLPS